MADWVRTGHGVSELLQGRHSMLSLNTGRIYILIAVCGGTLRSFLQGGLFKG
jgi:hypothetical protein